MNFTSKLTFAFLLIGLNALSARVAVTDSGTDFSHEWLVGRALINPNEIAGNRVDDDRNGKVDDIIGWNFADNYGKVFFKDHVTEIDPKVYTVMDILSRKESGTTTAADETFWKENISNLSKEEKAKFIANLNAFGQYAHSTHVSGIIASVSPEARMISNRVFADAPLSSVAVLAAKSVSTKGLTDYVYRLIATLTNGTFESAATYIAERQIDVANYSMGVSLQMIAKLALGLRGIKEPVLPAPKPGEKEHVPTEQEKEALKIYNEHLTKETTRLYVQYEAVGKKWFQKANNTLFVIASGNDGADNDKLPTFPGNIEVDNSISVGASQGVSALAKFSNFGAVSVDIVAPGVAIKSSVPSLDNKAVLPMSGTSMAAPYVTGVAAKMKDINPKLTPAQIKLMLMGTVDKKVWLKNKVVSGGVVNSVRAYAASEKSKSMITITAAIEAAIQSVPDQLENEIPKRISRISPVIREMEEFAMQTRF